jgi:hypothetical protein
MKTSLLFVCAGLALLPVRGADYYVNIAAGSDANDGLSPVSTGGSQGPFQTMGHACLALLPGDSLTVAPGNYPEPAAINIAKHVEGDAAITVKAADPQHHPVIVFPSGQNEARPAWSAFCLQVGHVSIDGIDTQNGISGYFLAPGVADVTLRNCRVTQAYEAGIILKGQADRGIDGVTIDGCEVTGCGQINADRSGKRDWPHAILGLWSTNVAITNCRVHDNFGEGLGPYTGCANWRITGNTVYDNWSVNIYIDTELGHILVAKNFVYCTYRYDPSLERDRPDGIRISNELHDHSIPDPAVKDVTVVNNVICGGDAGIRCSSYGPDYVEQGIHDGVIANNTVVSQQAHPIARAIWLGYDAAPNVNLRVFNNLTYDTAGIGRKDPLVVLDGPGLTVSHNFSGPAPGFVKPNVGWSVDAPPVAADYALAPGSPCLRAGTAADAPADDFTGAPRSAPPSIGAFDAPSSPP